MRYSLLLVLFAVGCGGGTVTASDYDGGTDAGPSGPWVTGHFESQTQRWDGAGWTKSEEDPQVVDLDVSAACLYDATDEPLHYRATIENLDWRFALAAYNVSDDGTWNGSTCALFDEERGLYWDVPQFFDGPRGTEEWGCDSSAGPPFSFEEDELRIDFRCWAVVPDDWRDGSRKRVDVRTTLNFQYCQATEIPLVEQEHTWTSICGWRTN